VPNLITLLRILVVPFFFSTLLYYTPERDYLRVWAFWLFLAGSLTDALDGFMARVRHEISQLGKFLDPLADKLLLLSGYIGILFANGFPVTPPLWIVVTIVFRDIVILGGLGVLFIANTPIEVKPNLLGKFTTGFQMATMLSLLLVLPISEWLWLITVALTIISGMCYVIREMQRLTHIV